MPNIKKYNSHNLCTRLCTMCTWRSKRPKQIEFYSKQASLKRNLLSLDGRSRKVGTIDPPNRQSSTHKLINWSLDDSSTESTSFSSSSTTPILKFKDSVSDVSSCGKSPRLKKKRSRMLRNYSTTSMLTPAVILQPQVQGVNY